MNINNAIHLSIRQILDMPEDHAQDLCQRLLAAGKNFEASCIQNGRKTIKDK